MFLALSVKPGWRVTEVRLVATVLRWQDRCWRRIQESKPPAA